MRIEARRIAAIETTSLFDVFVSIILWVLYYVCCSSS